MFDPILYQFMEDQHQALRDKIDAVHAQLDADYHDEAVELIEDVRAKYEQMVLLYHDCADKLHFDPAMLTFIRDEIVRVYDRLGWTEKAEDVEEAEK